MTGFEGGPPPPPPPPPPLPSMSSMSPSMPGFSSGAPRRPLQCPENSPCQELDQWDPLPRPRLAHPLYLGPERRLSSSVSVCSFSYYWLTFHSPEKSSGFALGKGRYPTSHRMGCTCAYA
jgi:hypothetical protein